MHADAGLVEALCRLIPRSKPIGLKGNIEHYIEAINACGRKAFNYLHAHSPCDTLVDLGFLTQFNGIEEFSEHFNEEVKHYIIEVPEPGAHDDSVVHTWEKSRVIDTFQKRGFNWSKRASNYLSARHHHAKQWHSILVFSKAESELNLHPIVTILARLEYNLKHAAARARNLRKWSADKKGNRLKAESRATTLREIRSNQACVPFQSSGSDLKILSTIEDGSASHVIVSPEYSHEFAKHQDYQDAVIQLDQESIATFLDVQGVETNIPQIKLPPKAAAAKLTLTTLFLADWEFLEPWIQHYRQYGVDFFILYFNGPDLPASTASFCDEQDDITLIAWDFTWWRKNHIKAKSNHHLAQPAQLMHAKLLLQSQTECEYLLSCDLDEYIIGPTSIKSLIGTGQEITFANLWAESSFTEKGPNLEEIRVPAQWSPDPYQKTKALREIKKFRRLKIHRNLPSNQLESTFVMLHFHQMTHGSLVGRTIENDGFIKLNRSTDHPAYSVWANRLT